jgi:membrane associated rhomboid family serine protease
MFPIGTDCPQRRIPWMNLLLIAANLVVFLVTRNHLAGSKYLLNPSAPRLYQFISYQFLHESWAHIIGNMLFLYVFGNNLNEKLGNVGYLAFYLTGGILAGCGQLLFSPVATLGASGAVSAVTGMFLVLLPRTNIRVLFVIFLYAEFEIPSLYLILFSFFRDAIGQLFGGGHVAYAAHITGTTCGFLLGMFLLMVGLIPRDAYDLLALLTRWRRRRQYQAVVAGGFDPFGPSRRVLSNPVPVGLPGVRRPLIAAAGIQGVMDLYNDGKIPEAAAAYAALLKTAPHTPLPEQAQLDIANQLAANGQAADAADAYEIFLHQYHTQRPQVQLLLGLIYARDVFTPDRAIVLLREALKHVTDPGQRQMGIEELERLDPNGPGVDAGDGVQG